MSEQGALWEIDRAARLDDLIAESNEIIDRAISFASEWEITGIVGLFSGGNDSTVLSHLLRGRVTHYAHANTQVGAEPTRQFVRDTCAAWGIPLLEEKPPGWSYEDLVLRRARSVASWARYDYIWPGGFPGSQAHSVFFGHIKDRALQLIKCRFNDSPRNQRLIYLNGRRMEESRKRAQLGKKLGNQPWQVVGSEIRVSPLLKWTKLDLNEYRRRFPDVPRNEIADLMHMSMECACGSKAHEGEMGEIETWLPSLAEWLHELEWRLARLDLDIDPMRLIWGNDGDNRCASGMCNI